MILSVNLCIVKKIRDMKAFMTLITVLVTAAVGSILLAAGNTVGALLLVPAIIYVIKTTS